MSFKSLAVRFAEQSAYRRVNYSEVEVLPSGKKECKVYFSDLPGFFYDIGETYAYEMLTNSIVLEKSDYNAGYSVYVGQPYDQGDITNAWHEYVINELISGKINLENYEEKDLINKIYKSARIDLDDYLDSYYDGYIGSMEKTGASLDKIMGIIMNIVRYSITKEREKCVSENEYSNMVKTINNLMYNYMHKLDEAKKNFILNNGKQITDNNGNNVWQMSVKDSIRTEILSNKIEELDAIRRYEVYLTDQAEENSSKEK